MSRTGLNHTYIRCIHLIVSREIHHTYGHIQCTYRVCANPSCEAIRHEAAMLCMVTRVHTLYTHVSTSTLHHHPRCSLHSPLVAVQHAARTAGGATWRSTDGRLSRLEAVQQQAGPGGQTGLGRHRAGTRGISLQTLGSIGLKNRSGRKSSKGFEEETCVH